MFEVIIRTQFSAAHRIKYLDGKYENLHGHNWTAKVIAQAKVLNSMGVAVDFVLLREKTKEHLSSLDYQFINEIPPFDEINPTAENIAYWLHKKLSETFKDEQVKIVRVEISEMPDCGAAYEE